MKPYKKLRVKLMEQEKMCIRDRLYTIASKNLSIAISFNALTQNTGINSSFAIAVFTPE